MKKIILPALMLAMSLTAGAVRPIHKLFPVKQNDGTTVMLYKNGDGHLAFYTTEDDKVVVRDANGRLCYAELNSKGELVAASVAVHNLAERTAAEKSFVSTLTLLPTDEALRPLLQDPYHTTLKGVNVKRTGNASTSDGLGKFGTNSGGAVPSNGNITIPVIMVAFQDKDFSAGNDTAKISRYFNEAGYHEDNSYEVGSVKDYFTEASYGHFVPTFDVCAKVTLAHPYSYYGANQTSGSNRGASDVRSMQMVQDAVAAAIEQGVDFSKYKGSNGIIPNVSIMYAGLGEATGGDENTIWPHERDLGIWFPISGFTFGSYFVGNEMYDDNNIMGIGVFCHEFSHALGLPDFYCTDYSYGNDAPFGYWSIMDNGEYYANSYAPVGYNAYERSFMGWLDVKELSDAQAVTLENPNNTDAAYAALIRNPSNNNEYFILENRQPDTWYPSSMGSGLLVTRIAYSRSDWTNNILNNKQNTKRAMVVTANGSTIGLGLGSSTLGNPNHLFGNGVNYAESLPLYNGSSLTSAPFYKVIKNGDGTITLNFKDNSLLPSNVATNGKVFEKITDISQLAAGDSVIFVNETEKVALSATQQGYFRGAANINVDNGEAKGNDEVLVFDVLKSTRSNRWGFRCENGYLSASGSGVNIASNSSNALTDITFNNGNATVYFSGNNKRYLGYASPQTYFTSFTSDPGNIQIYRLKVGTVDGINAIRNAADKVADNRVYNLNGQFVGTSLTGLQKGVYIQNGKKVVVK